MSADETTPLIGDGGRAGGHTKKPGPMSRLWGLASVEHRILLTGFLITLSFSYTQVSILYVFRLMVCDDYYSKHAPFDGPGDRCARNAIAAGTATQYSILGMSTTLCGTMNLFVTGMVAKKYGPRFALILQTVVPAARVVTQILGVIAGGRAGITIIQATQIITILGGPSGYILVVNIIAGEVVKPARRTSVFGQLQGCIMLGQGIGYLAGGMIGDKFGIQRPFEVACVSFLVASVYVRAALPYIAPESMSDGKRPARGGLAGFVAPLKVLAPQKLRLQDGRLRNHYGVLFLCCGVFLGVLATGYAPSLIQMYATAAFEFDQGDNGWLMSEFAFMRSLFLICLFPPIISSGRSWFRSLGPKEKTGATARREAYEPEIPTEPQQIEAPTSMQGEEEPLLGPDPESERQSCGFDLFFLRWSLMVDGIMTTVAAFATKKWHIYLAAFLLPFGSGSAPAAKGVITEMCPSSQRADALNAITLVENIARLATQGLFGFVFSALADVGQAYMTFFCNAAIAVLGMGVLLFSHFPALGSTLIEDDESEDDVQA